VKDEDETHSWSLREFREKLVERFQSAGGGADAHDGRRHVVRWLIPGRALVGHD